MSKVTVVGSYVVDLMCKTPKMPKIGETVLGGPFKMGPGGKGGNQGVAVARLGGEVTMVTKVGKDEFGALARENFNNEKINTNYIFEDEEESTGAALIAVDSSSENMIIVALGACGNLSREDVEQAEKEIAESKVVLVQLETNIEAVEAAIEIANKYCVPVILNPAPYQQFPQKFLQKIQYITPNETEGSLLTGIEIVDEESALQAALKLNKWGVPNVIITLGKKGCYLYTKESGGELISGFSVNALDTTGAGDAFNGGLAFSLANGYPLRKALSYANATAALSVTKLGTAPAMPYKEEVDIFLRNMA
ncbi:ribokinase [Neobacillus sp. NPDC093127]|uniref:ribokinase n=1 Tax=Neobacillus sp. NPDC093127 TaxID=3364296 RepID=UPI0038037B2F